MVKAEYQLPRGRGQYTHCKDNHFSCTIHFDQSKDKNVLKAQTVLLLSDVKLKIGGRVL